MAADMKSQSTYLDPSHDIGAVDGEDDNQTTGITNPRDTDVLCGRGGAALRHPGNQTYRRLVNLNKGLYTTCLKTEKLKISRSIVAAIREQKGRFLEKENGSSTWYDIGDKKAIEKTSQALREGQPKLRQEIAESQQQVVGSLGLGFPQSDVNPHNLPFGVGGGVGGASSIVLGGVNNSNNITASVSNTFPGPSLHSMASITSLGSGILSNSFDAGSFRSGQSDVAICRGGETNNGRMGSGMSNSVASFIHQQQQLNQNSQPRGDHRNNYPVEYQGQQPQDLDLLLRLAAAQQGNHNHNNFGNDNGNGFQTGDFGCTVHTIDSAAMNTVNTFNTLNTIHSINTSDMSRSNNRNLGKPMTENLQQRLVFAREAGNQVSQLSLMSDFNMSTSHHPNTPSRMASNRTTGTMLSGRTFGTALSDMDDSFQKALNGMPLSPNNAVGRDKFNGNESINIGNMNNLIRDPLVSTIHLGAGNHDSVDSSFTNMSMFNVNARANDSVDSSFANASTFNMNVSNMNIPSSMHTKVSQTPSGRTGSTISTSNLQLLQLQQQQQQQQQLLMQQQQQQQQLLIQKQKEQQQLLLQQQEHLQYDSSDKEVLVTNNNNTVASHSKTARNDGDINFDTSGSNHSFDRRRVFATMKYVGPKSNIDEPVVTTVNINQGGPVRYQQQRPVHKSNNYQPKQPEVTTIKISDGVSGTKNKHSTQVHEESSEFAMSESARSIMSNLSMLSINDVSDSKLSDFEDKDERGEKDRKKKAEHRSSFSSRNHNKVIVEVAKVIDRSSGDDNMGGGGGGGGGSRRSLMSGISRSDMSAVSIFSDLSRKIGHVSPKDMGLDDMSMVDYVDMDDQTQVLDNDSNRGATNTKHEYDNDQQRKQRNLKHEGIVTGI